MAVTTSAASLTTSWLPITTAWLAPTTCSSILWGAHRPWIALNDPGYGISVDPNLSCLPPAATTWWEQNNTATTYSIGPIVCPAAYTTATTSVRGSSTFVACCPSNYDLNSLADHGTAVQCQSWMSRGQVVTIVLHSTIGNTKEITSKWVTSVSTVAQRAVVDGVQINGWNFPATTTSSSSSASTGKSSLDTSTGPAATSPGLDALNPPVQSKQSSGISTGAKAGIGIACGVTALAAIVFALLYFRARNPNSNRPLAGSPESATLKGGEMDDYYAPPTSPQEVHATPVVAEMMTYGGHQDRAELADRPL